MKLPTTFLLFACIVVLIQAQPPLPPTNNFVKPKYAVNTNQLPQTITWACDYQTLRVEWWSCTNLSEQNWYLATDVVATMTFTIPANKPAEFFKCRFRDLVTGKVSGWNTK